MLCHMLQQSFLLIYLNFKLQTSIQATCRSDMLEFPGHLLHFIYLFIYIFNYLFRFINADKRMSHLGNSANIYQIFIN